MKKVLIADDAVFMRMRIKRALQDLDCEFMEAENGQVAVDLFQQEHPDLVLLDISMPVMNGLDALKIMSQQQPDIPVVICSAIGQEASIMEALSLGAKEFIVKPFTNDHIQKIAKQFLKL